MREEVAMRCISMIVCAIALASALPQIRTAPYINLGMRIIVHYNVTDGQDGRGTYGPGMNVSHSAQDWIGLYKKGSCMGDGDSSMRETFPTDHIHNLHSRHQCYLHWQYIPYDEPSGRVIFDFDFIKTAGEYDVRYFYGDNPTVLGNFRWRGQGYVCHSWLDPSGAVAHDPRHQEDLGTPSTTGVPTIDKDSPSAPPGEPCPGGGLAAHKRCWYLGEAGQSCEAVCQNHSMLYHYQLPASPVVPRLLGRSVHMLPTPTETSFSSAPPIGSAVECYSPSDNMYSSAIEGAAGGGDWQDPTCQLACPCTLPSSLPGTWPQPDYPGLNEGVDGSNKITSLTLDDCQCNPDTVTSTLTIVRASLGDNCWEDSSDPVERSADNMNAAIAKACDGKVNCTYTVDVSQAKRGDPAEWCSKDLDLYYTCSGAYTPCTSDAGQTDSACRQFTKDAVTSTSHHYEGVNYTQTGKTIILQCPQSAARDECLMKRAACGRCALDAVARAGPITVVGGVEGTTYMRGGYTAWQDTEDIPGFEVGVN